MVVHNSVLGVAVFALCGTTVSSILNGVLGSTRIFSFEIFNIFFFFASPAVGRKRVRLGKPSHCGRV